MLEIFRKDTSTIVIHIKDENGVTLSDLATATDVRFLVKKNAADLNSAAIITKYIGSGLTINDPATGDVTVVLSAGDTTQLADTYVMGLKVKYAASEKTIILDTSSLRIIQNVVD